MKDEKKNEEIEESWNKKRVGIVLIILLFLAVGLIYLFKDSFSFNKPQQAQSTKVLSASDTNLEDIVQKQVQLLKREAFNIDIEEIASSSPQVKRLIEDLKSLQNIPKDKAKEACFNICKGL